MASKAVGLEGAVAGQGRVFDASTETVSMLCGKELSSTYYI
jgi:hypothetical protein